MIVGRFLVVPVLRMIGRTRLREIFTAASLLLVIGIAMLRITSYNVCYTKLLRGNPQRCNGNDSACPSGYFCHRGTVDSSDFSTVVCCPAIGTG